MEGSNIIKSILPQLYMYGFFNSAFVATYNGGPLDYFAWYKGECFIEKPEYLRHLAAVIRMIRDKDREQKADLNLGEPGKRILLQAGVEFRHLSLDEQVRFSEGYYSPAEHFNPSLYYDHVDGKLTD